jgi:eukaryotic-like serine/threonine-protein kinase
MSLGTGARIGVYEVIAAIGAGGMGEVYRARDTRLKREVALKILPASFADDPDRLARFQREAEVLASLNHPNIAAIYGLEEGADVGAGFSRPVQALVMELVEGETLADRIARGAIPVDEALPIAKQIAEALEAAHEQGIIHRDLKPANIKMRPDGTVKVLDFGLAKLSERGSAIRDPGSDRVGAGFSRPNSLSPTMTSPALMTGVGVLLGTAAYMSPEQAKGRPADKRSDIWAFGCVLYEMLTGKRAFEGDDVAETLANVLKSQADWTAIPASTASSVVRLLRRCLAKVPTARLRDIGDARLDIDEALTTDNPITPGTLRNRERFVWAAAVVIVLVAAAAFIRTREPSVAAREMRLEITTPPTSDPISLALSPDGQKLVFVGTASGRSQLWLRSLDSTSIRPLDRTTGASFPFWSPDSRSIGFFADGRLRRLDLDGGLAQELAVAPQGRGGSWNGDGTIVFAPNTGGPIFRVSSSGGAPVAVTRIEEGSGILNHRSPQFLPDGRHFLYYVLGGGTVFVGELDSAETKQILTNVDAGAVYASGHVFFSRQRTLFAQSLDTDRLEVIGSPFPVAQQIAEGPNMAGLSASPAGTIAVRTGATGGRRQIAWFDRAGKEIGKVGDSGFLLDPSLSRDGRYIAVRRQVEAASGIGLLNGRDGVFTQFTSGQAGGGGSFPLWSPDGSRIVYSANQGSRVNDLFLKPVTGAGREEVLLSTPQIKAAMDWSANGEFVLYRTVSPKTGNDLFVLAMDDHKSFAVAETEFDERDGQFSPDGRWVALVSNESGRPEIYVQPFPGPGRKQSISSNGGGQPRWRRDGKELFYIAVDGRMMAVAIDTAGGQLTGSAPVPLFTTNVGAAVQANNRQQYDVSVDGQRFLMNTIVEDAADPIILIQNWRPPTASDAEAR